MICGTVGEEIEVFFVDFTTASGAVIGDGEGLGRIFNDDIGNPGEGGGRDD